MSTTTTPAWMLTTDEPQLAVQPALTIDGPASTDGWCEAAPTDGAPPEGATTGTGELKGQSVHVVVVEPQDLFAGIRIDW